MIELMFVAEKANSRHAHHRLLSVPPFTSIFFLFNCFTTASGIYKASYTSPAVCESKTNDRMRVNWHCLKSCRQGSKQTPFPLPPCLGPSLMVATTARHHHITATSDSPIPAAPSHKGRHQGSQIQGRWGYNRVCPTVDTEPPGKSSSTGGCHCASSPCSVQDRRIENVCELSPPLPRTHG